MIKLLFTHEPPSFVEAYLKERGINYSTFTVAKNLVTRDLQIEHLNGVDAVIVRRTGTTFGELDDHLFIATPNPPSIIGNASVGNDHIKVTSDLKQTKQIIVVNDAGHLTPSS